jgi:hypothetical protein
MATTPTSKTSGLVPTKVRVPARARACERGVVGVCVHACVRLRARELTSVVFDPNDKTCTGSGGQSCFRLRVPI